MKKFYYDLLREFQTSIVVAAAAVAAAAAATAAAAADLVALLWGRRRPQPTAALQCTYTAIIAVILNSFLLFINKQINNINKLKTERR